MAPRVITTQLGYCHCYPQRSPIPEAQADDNTLVSGVLVERASPQESSCQLIAPEVCEQTLTLVEVTRKN